jgi:amino acid transporter
MSNTAAAIEPAASSNAPRTLRRTLTLRDLILYGIIVIQPVAPMSSFGTVTNKGHGHTVTAILIAMVAMLLTALSYGRMARVYPSAGSAFTYVGRELHPSLGYITGWSMVMDYVVNPLICIIWCSGMAASWSGLPRPVWAVFFFALFTGLNLRGVKTSARFNTILAAVMIGVIVAFLAAALRYLIFGDHGPLDYARPFYDRERWNTGFVFGATATAVLTYIGFDGISTLSEEVENPRRNILLATVFSCLAIGILSAIQVYVAQILHPWTEPFANEETAFGLAASKAAPWLATVIGAMLLVANTGSGTGAQLGAARLLYGMGRSGALPGKFFSYISPGTGVPRNNVLLVGAIALFGSFFLSFGMGADLLNFGALIAFMGVNLATFVHYFLRQKQRTLGNSVLPLTGFLICGLLWWNLSGMAKLVGAIWMAVGIAYGAWKTRGFRGDLVNFDLPPEDS